MAFLSCYKCDVATCRSEWGGFDRVRPLHSVDNLCWRSSSFTVWNMTQHTILGTGDGGGVGWGGVGLLRSVLFAVFCFCRLGQRVFFFHHKFRRLVAAVSIYHVLQQRTESAGPDHPKKQRNSRRETGFTAEFL